MLEAVGRTQRREVLSGRSLQTRSHVLFHFNIEIVKSAIVRASQPAPGNSSCQQLPPTAPANSSLQQLLSKAPANSPRRQPPSARLDVDVGCRDDLLRPRRQARVGLRARHAFSRFELVRTDRTAVFLLKISEIRSRVWTNLKLVGGPWRSILVMFARNRDSEIVGTKILNTKMSVRLSNLLASCAPGLRKRVFQRGLLESANVSKTRLPTTYSGSVSIPGRRGSPKVSLAMPSRAIPRPCRRPAARRQRGWGPEDRGVIDAEMPKPCLRRKDRIRPD